MEKLINSINLFFDDDLNKDIILSNKKTIQLDYKRFVCGLFDTIIAEEILDNPDETLELFSFIYKEHTGKSAIFLLSNLPESSKHKIKDIKKESIGKLFSFECTVSRVCDNTIQTTDITYECKNCSKQITIPQPIDFVKPPPKKCGCGAVNPFKILSKKQENIQKIMVEDFVSEISEDYNPVMRMGIIKGDIVNPGFLQPGMRIEVIGVVRTKEIAKDKTEEDFFININNILPKDYSFYSMKLTKKDIEKIKELSKDNHLIEQMAQSISPGTEGMEIIRRALVLQHFRGDNIYDENNNLDDRGTINICLVGSPGTNKSYVGGKTIKLNPIHIFTSGRGISGVGLVGAVTFDKSLNRWVLDAGALPFSHNGIICIDEADKISKEDLAYLNNAMSNLSVPFNKANIKKTLKTDVCVLLCANPTNRVFDNYTEKFRQIGIPQDILDRFDLVFVVEPQKEESFRKRVIHKIIKRHKKEIKPKINWELFSKYIAYTWQNIHPEISEKNEDYILEKVDELIGPKTQKKQEVSFRIIGNVLRLAKAHARLYLSNKMRKKDVDEAINLIKESFQTLEMIDKSNKLVIESFQGEPKKEIKNAYKIILDSLGNKKLIAEEELLKATNLTQHEFDEIMEKLKRTGDVFSPRRGFWKLLG